MKQLFQIEEAYTATHGGGDGTAQVSHMRITSSQAEHVEKVYASLLAGEVVQTMSGKVQIREV